MINMGELFANDRIGTIDMERVPMNEKELSSMLVDEGDLLFARQSLVLSGAGKCSIVNSLDEETTFESHIIRVRLKKDLAYPDFFFYYFKSPASGIKSIVTQGVQAGIRGNDLKTLPVSLPPIAEQVKIANLLTQYDDLLENNRRRIQLLEESARLLYQEWFVHLRFPGHEQVKITNGVPKGWTKEPLGSLLTLQRGFDLPVSKRLGGTVPIYASTGVNGFHNTPKVKGPGVVTGRSGTLGRVMFVAQDFWPLNTTLWVKEFKKVSPIFATYLLRAMKLEGYNGGAAVPTLNRNDVHKVDVLCPDLKLMSEFENQTSVVFEQIDKLKEYNQKLAQARDLLLPKLMSGEITV